MGGWGSGRARQRRELETCRVVDVRDFARRGLLNSQRHVADGLGAFFGRGFVRLGLPGTRTQTVVISESRCNFGGTRSWFVCPRCAGRSAALYLSTLIFDCRQCANLGYSSQYSGAQGRCRLKLLRACRALGVEPDCADVIDESVKPRGMHWSTFSRRSEAARRAFDQWEHAWMAAGLRLIG